MKTIQHRIPGVKIKSLDSFADFRGYTSVLFDEKAATALDFYIVQISIRGIVHSFI